MVSIHTGMDTGLAGLGLDKPGVGPVDPLTFGCLFFGIFQLHSLHFM